MSSDPIWLRGVTVTLSGFLAVCPEGVHGSMHRRVKQVVAEERLTSTPSDLVSEV